MNLSKKKKLYVNIFFIIPFLISLFFYFYSMNNKKFEINYILNINDEFIFMDNILRRNSDLPILSLLGDIMEEKKYSNEIKNIEQLRNEKKLILKEWRLIDEDTPRAKYKFSIFGYNYEESMLEEYVSDLFAICLKSFLNQLEFRKNLLINKSRDIEKILDDYNKNVLKLSPEKYITFELDAKSINLIEKAKNILISEEKSFIKIKSKDLIVKSNTHFFILSVILYFITSLIMLFILKFYLILNKNILTIKKETKKIKSEII